MAREDVQTTHLSPNPMLFKKFKKKKTLLKQLELNALSEVQVQNNRISPYPQFSQKPEVLHVG